MKKNNDFSYDGKKNSYLNEKSKKLLDDVINKKTLQDKNNKSFFQDEKIKKIVIALAAIFILSVPLTMSASHKTALKNQQDQFDIRLSKELNDRTKSHYRDNKKELIDDKELVQLFETKERQIDEIKKLYEELGINVEFEAYNFDNEAYDKSWEILENQAYPIDFEQEGTTYFSERILGKDYAGHYIKKGSTIKVKFSDHAYSTAAVKKRQEEKRKEIEDMKIADGATDTEKDIFDTRKKDLLERSKGNLSDEELDGLKQEFASTNDDITSRIQTEAREKEEALARKREEQNVMQEYCVDGTPAYGNPSARGKANSCYGHGGWQRNH